jgi:hypothetical protein
LRLAGVRVSSKAQNHEATYRRLQDASERVARPAGVNGVQLDRILFNNYDDILREMRVMRASNTESLGDALTHTRSAA